MDNIEQQLAVLRKERVINVMLTSALTVALISLCDGDRARIARMKERMREVILLALPIDVAIDDEMHAALARLDDIFHPYL